MQGEFARRSPRVSGAAKVNNNRLWVEEHLAFNECGGRSRALADGVDAEESSDGVGEIVGCSKEVGLKRRRIAVVAKGEVVVEPPSLYFVVGTEEQC